MRSEAKGEESSAALRLQFLGTGASDWPFRKYPRNREQLLSGDYRGSSSMLVEGRILVDCGPTVPAAMEMFDVDTSRVSDIMITHTHADHFSTKAVRSVAAEGKVPLNLWVEKGAFPRAQSLSDVCRIREIEAGTELTTAGCSVLPLPSGHVVGRSRETSLYFLFSDESRRILYALDGAWLTKQAWEAVRDLELDAVIWDGTIGDVVGDPMIFGHNSIPMLRIMNETLKAAGVFRASTRIILSHMGRHLQPGHRELRKNLEKDGMEPAHDGMVVEI